MVNKLYIAWSKNGAKVQRKNVINYAVLKCCIVWACCDAIDNSFSVWGRPHTQRRWCIGGLTVRQKG